MTRPIAIVGPTGTGKSALALAVAEQLGGEIVNADAMQLTAAWTSGPRNCRPTSGAASRTISSTSSR